MAGFTLLGVSLLLAGAGTATQVVGQVKAGRAARRAGEAGQAVAESQAELAEFNASVADLQAKDARELGAEEERRYRQGVDVLIGAQRAGIAAGNVDVGYGSAVDVQADAAYMGELDALTIRTNAAREAWGYEVEATDLRKRAEIARQEGVYLEREGRERQGQHRLAAAGAIIGGGASLLEARYGFNRGRGPAPAPRSLHRAGAGD